MIGADTGDELRRERPGAATDVDHPLTLHDPGEVGESCDESASSTGP